jgi:hypothetical protein
VCRDWRNSAEFANSFRCNGLRQNCVRFLYCIICRQLRPFCGSARDWHASCFTVLPCKGRAKRNANEREGNEREATGDEIRNFLILSLDVGRYCPLRSINHRRKQREPIAANISTDVHYVFRLDLSRQWRVGSFIGEVEMTPCEKSLLEKLQAMERERDEARSQLAVANEYATGRINELHEIIDSIRCERDEAREDFAIARKQLAKVELRLTLKIVEVRLMKHRMKQLQEIA